VTALADLARRVPKVDLHCHLTGAIRPDALLELAATKGRRLDAAKLRDTFDLASAGDTEREDKFFAGLDIVAGLLTRPEDLAFAVQSVAGYGAAQGNLKYLELFVNPTALMRTGMSFRQVRDGLLDGARTAQIDHDVTVRFIACFLREESTAYAEQMLADLLQYRTEEFLGVGLDGPENLPSSPHARFADVFRRAGAAGLKRTAHLTETSASDLTVCLDQLGCDRIDHGYPVMDDPAMVARLRAAATPVTCCLTITRDIIGPVDARFTTAVTHPTTQMIQAGIPFSLGTDDPAMVGTNIGTEYALATEWWGWDFDALAAMSLYGLDAAWMDTTDRAAWRKRFEAELAALRDADPAHG
jgi:adenosine deaminase